MKKLLYVYQNYWKTYSSATLSILRGFEKIENLDVENFEVKPLSYKYNLNRILNNLPFVRATYFNRQNVFLEKLIKTSSFDYVFVMKGTDINSVTLQNIKRDNPGIQLICFNPDDPFNLASSSHEIIESIKHYDYYCIWTKQLEQKLKEAGAKKIVYFPFGVDEEIIFPVEAEYRYDISFSGNGDEERHRIIHNLVSELKSRELDINVHVFGNNWYSTDEKLIVHGPQYGKDLLEKIAATKINLNLLRKQNKNAINMRTFEIPAAGGFMFHEESSEAEQFFTPNKDVVYFSSIKELVDLSEKYLNDDDTRRKMVEASSKKISQGNYSYQKIIESSLKNVI